MVVQRFYQIRGMIRRTCQHYHCVEDRRLILKLPHYSLVLKKTNTEEKRRKKENYARHSVL